MLDLMRDIILATDLAHHLRIFKDLQKMAEGEAPGLGMGAVVGIHPTKAGRWHGRSCLSPKSLCRGFWGPWGSFLSPPAPTPAPLPARQWATTPRTSSTAACCSACS